MRERFVYDKYYGEGKREVWWKYMTELHQRCYNKVTVECSRNVMEDLGISYEESKLYAMNSFSKKDKLVENMFTSKYSFEDFIKKTVDDPDIQNPLLDSEMAYYRDYGTVIFPAIVINNQTFRG